MPPKRQRRTDLLCVVHYDLYTRLKDLGFDIADDTFQRRIRESNEHWDMVGRRRIMGSSEWYPSDGIHYFMHVIERDISRLNIYLQDAEDRDQWLRDVELSPFMLAYKCLRMCTITNPPEEATNQAAQEEPENP
jgi:hypothetical protein